MSLWVALLVLFAITAVFGLFAFFLVRGGFRANYLNDMPLIEILVYTIGIQIVQALLEWLVGEPVVEGFGLRIGIAAALAAFASILWGAGFLFGAKKRRQRFDIHSG